MFWLGLTWFSLFFVLENSRIRLQFLLKSQRNLSHPYVSDLLEALLTEWIVLAWPGTDLNQHCQMQAWFFLTSMILPTWRLNQCCMNLLSSVSLFNTGSGLTAETLRQLAITMVSGYYMTRLANSLARQLGDTSYCEPADRKVFCLGQISFWVGPYHKEITGWHCSVFYKDVFWKRMLRMHVWGEKWFMESLSDLWHCSVWAVGHCHIISVT